MVMHYKLKRCSDEFNTSIPVQVVLHFRWVVPTELHPSIVDTT